MYSYDTLLLFHKLKLMTIRAMLLIPKTGKQEIIPFLDRAPALTIVVTMKIEEVNGAFQDIDASMDALAGECSVCCLTLLPRN